MSSTGGATMGWPSTVTSTPGRVTSAVTPPDEDEVSLTSHAEAGRQTADDDEAERAAERQADERRAGQLELASAS